MPRLLRSVVLLVVSVAWLAAAPTPVEIKPVHARHGAVVAAHPQAAAAGLAVLQAGGNAIDAAVATSLAVGVAEPYGSGLGGKLMLLYFEAATGKVHVVDGMDAAGSVDVAAYLKRPEEDRSYGYASVCVPGLAAGLWSAHRCWGSKPWAETVAPAIALARDGFEILPKSREQFAEQEKKLRRGDPEIARLYLPGGKLPEVGTRLPNPDLVRTMEALARHGRDGFYRGWVAAAIATASAHGGGALTLEDLAGYEARITDGMTMDLRGYRLWCAPPPASGAALFLPILKVLENESFGGGPLRTAANIHQIGRVWRVVSPLVARTVGDAEESRFRFEKLLAPDSIAELRAKAFGPPEAKKKVAQRDTAWSPFFESSQAATTHFLVADAKGNIVCATQSQSLHFGAGVVPPGTGVVMNNSMSNFTLSEPTSLNYVAPGRRPRSTISPTIVLRAGKPVFALGVPGSSRIPTAMLQVLADRLILNRPLAEAIGDTRFHFSLPFRKDETEAFEAEQAWPAEEAEALRALGWKVNLPEPAGTGKYFGGVNAIEFHADGSMTAYADPRRTNAAAGF